MRTVHGIAATTLFLATWVACAPAGPDAAAVTPSPASPPASTAGDSARIAALEEATRPGEPLQISFDWSLQDRDARFSGKGLVRMQAPWRARLDLFAAQDVQVVRAVLNEDELDVEYSGPAVSLPPAAFLWSVLGVFRAPAAVGAATLADTRSGFDLTWRDGGAHWRFQADSATLRGAEWQGADGGKRTVELSGPFRYGRPTTAQFRDWREYRELKLTVTAVERVDPFGPETWNVSSR